MSIDTAVSATSTIQTPSNMDDADWSHFRKLDKLELDWSPRSILDHLKISPNTVRRILGYSETKVANAERHLRYKSSTYKPQPCSYVVRPIREDEINGEDVRMKVVDYYDGNRVKPGYKPSPLKVDRGGLGYEDAFYEAVGLGGDKHRFPIVDVEQGNDDEVATMSYEHKTGGAISFIKKAVAKMTRRKNYGTCLSTISPYRS